MEQKSKSKNTKKGGPGLKKSPASKKIKQMRITRRFVDSKRHTVAYLVNGKRQNVAESTRLASKGQISGVRVVGNHIQAAIGRRPLAKLPTTVVNA